MAYCNGSLYRNNSCGCGNNSGSCGYNSNGSCRCNSGCGCNGNNGVCGCNSGCGCNGNNGVCGCNNNGNCNNNGTCGCSNRPTCNFPPRPSVCSTCPPGTFPCPCRPPFYPNYCPCGCGGSNSLGFPSERCGGSNSSGFPSERVGTFAFLNSSGTTLTTGSIVPLRYVLGTGNLAKNTTSGALSLESGTYTASYSISGVIPESGVTITITPEYGGILHPEFARSFTSTATAQSFELSGLLGITLPTDTTLSLNLTIFGDVTVDTTIIGVNASMIINKIHDITG